MGSKARITASSSDPADTLIFTSSNPEVVTVDSEGIVTGISPGTATIGIAGSRSGARTEVKVTVMAPIVIQPEVPTISIAPNIVQAGYGFTRLTLSSISGGKATLNAIVVGGEGKLRVEAFYTTTGLFGEPIPQSIGILQDKGDGLYELEFPGIPPGAVPVGEIPLPGLGIEVRDSKGRMDKWPSVMIGGDGTGIPSGAVRVPLVDLTKAQAPVPIIFQSGYGLSRLLITPQLGGTFILQATVFGGAGNIRVHAFYETVDVFGKKVSTSLGALQDQDGDGVYKLEIPIPPGVLTAGGYALPGLRITAIDGLGQIDSWPALNIFR